MGKVRNVYMNFTGNLKEMGHLEFLSLNRRIILEYIIEKYGTRVWNVFICLRVGSKFL
jgi:hypothetical protein